jgi:hypothetical protein
MVKRTIRYVLHKSGGLKHTKEYENTIQVQAPTLTPLLDNIGKPLPATTQKRKTKREERKVVITASGGEGGWGWSRFKW